MSKEGELNIVKRLLGKEKNIKMASFKGVSATQDKKFVDKEKKLLRTTVFPTIYSTAVDIKKVNIQVFREWIYEKITQLLNMEDDIVTEYAFSLLEEESIDPKIMQIKLTGFLESKTEEFMIQLWTLLIDAQNSIGGIPKEFLERKKKEILQKKKEDERLERELEKRRESSSREYNPRRDSRDSYRDSRDPRNYRERREHYSRQEDRYERNSNHRDSPYDKNHDRRTTRESFHDKRESREKTRSPSPSIT